MPSMAESKLGSQEVNETNFVAIRNFYKDIFLQKGTYLVCIVIYLQNSEKGATIRSSKYFLKCKYSWKETYIVEL